MPNCTLPRDSLRLTPACTARWTLPTTISKACWRGRCRESHLMDSLNPEHPPVTAAPAGRPLIWGFWGTALWGLFIFAAMFIGQIAVVGWLVLRQGGPIDIATMVHVVSGGITIALSVIAGLPAVLAALWLAIRLSRMPFA